MSSGNGDSWEDGITPSKKHITAPSALITVQFSYLKNHRGIMRVLIIGTGYVGLTTGVALVEAVNS